MLPKHKRVSREDMGFIKKANVFGSNDLFSLRAIEKGLPNSKISFSVSKKVAKSAVVRNRLRRFGYRSVESIIDSIKNYLIVFYFKKIPKGFEEVEEGVKDLLNKTKIK